MLVKTEKYKKGDILVWNAPHLQKTFLSEKLKSFIAEHGKGPYYVSLDFLVYNKSERERWIYIKSTDKNDKSDMSKIDEKCFIHVNLASPFIEDEIGGHI